MTMPTELLQFLITTPLNLNRTQLKLSSLRLGNFRSVHSADIDLRDLTLVVGANSAGKSSLLSVLRLLSQAQQQDEASPVISLNGKELSLGTFEDLVRQSPEGHNGEREITIGLTFVANISGRLVRRRYNHRLENRESLQPARDHAVSLRIDLTLRESRTLGDGVGAVVQFDAEFAVDGEVVEDLTLRLREADSPDQTTSSDEISGTMWGTTRGRFLRPAGSPFRSVMQGRAFSNWMVTSQQDMDEDHGDSQPEMSGTLNLKHVGTTMVSQNIDSWRSWGGLPTLFTTVSTPIDHLRYLLELIVSGELRDPRRSLLRRSDLDAATRAKATFAGAEDETRAADPADPSVWLLRVLGDMGPQRATTPNDLFVLSTFPESSTAITHVLANWDDFAKALAETDTAWSRRAYFDARPSILQNAIQSVVSFFANDIEYLGPLRQGPKRLYSYGERGSSNELGQDAEYFAYFLARFGDKKVEEGLSGLDGAGAVNLCSALSNWAKRLRIADEVQVKETPGIGRQVEVRMPGVARPITWDKVGIGVSQVLPVLLKVLASDKGSVVLLEQPELHLHPDSQAELAEFLLQAARFGRQVIVESHSDTFLTRLRRLVVESSLQGSDDVRNAIAFVFAHRDHGTGVTEFENIELDRTGTFPRWPDGFADRAHVESEALLKARLAALSNESASPS